MADMPKAFHDIVHDLVPRECKTVDEPLLFTG